MMVGYREMSELKTHLLLDLWVVGVKLEVITHGRKLSADKIHEDDVFLLGMFLLNIDDARRYLSLYKSVDTVKDVPDHLALIKQWYDAENSKAIHDVPTGTNYGYRQALILMTANKYTPNLAKARLVELEFVKIDFLNI
jgi:hypothetical protein